MSGTICNYPIPIEEDRSITWSVGDTVKIRFEVTVHGLFDNDYIYIVPLKKPYEFRLRFYNWKNDLLLDKTKTDMEEDGIVEFTIDEEETKLFKKGEYKVQLNVMSEEMTFALLNREENIAVVK